MTKRYWPGLVIGVAVAAVLLPSAALADTTTTTTTTTDTAPAPPPPTPPAPPGFASSLTSLYSNMYNAVVAIDSKTGQTTDRQLESPAAFSQSVNSMPSGQLAEFYAATQQAPNWDQMAPESRQLLTDAQSAPSAQSSTSVQSRSRRSQTHAKLSSALRLRHVARRGPTLASTASATSSPFPPPEPVGSFPAPPSLPFQPSNSVGPFAPMTCVAGPAPYAYYVASDTAVYVGQVVADAANLAVAVIPDTEVFNTPVIGNTSYPVPYRAVAAAIELAAQVVVNSFTAARSSVDDCVSANASGFVANIDNTTVNAFALETQNEQILSNAESSINTIHDQIHVVEQSLNDELTAEIQQALALPGAAPADVYYELPAASGGNLDSTPVGVQAVVTNAFNSARGAGLPINSTASTDLAAANSALSSHNYKTAWKDYQAAYQALG